MSVVRGRKAAACHQHIVEGERNQRPIGDPNATSIRQVNPSRVAARVVLLDGRTAEPDLIVELPCCEYILARHSVLALHSPTLAYPNLRSERDQLRIGIPRNLLLEETQILQRLPAALDFSVRKELHITGIAEGTVARFE